MASKKPHRSSWANWDWGQVGEWMKENPLATWKEFKRIYPKFPYSDSSYYAMRRKLNDGSLYKNNIKHRQKNPIYQIIGKLETKEIRKLKPLDAMNKLLSIIKQNIKTDIEMVELSNPEIIEIRRFTQS